MGTYYLYVDRLYIDERAITIDERVVDTLWRSSTNTLGWSKCF